MKTFFARKIATVCIVASFLLLPASMSFGDDFTTSVGAGSKAMLFNFSGLSVLGAQAFDGGLGAKYYLSDPLALRVSIPFAYTNESVRANAANQTADGSNSGVRVGLAAAAEYHFLKTRVSPYAGGGLGILYASTTEKRPTTSTTIGTTTTTTDIKEANNAAGLTVGSNFFQGGTAFNAALLAGVEFFIVKEVSLSAEYQFGYGLTSQSDQKITTVVTTTAGGVTSSNTNTVTTKEGALNQFGITAAGVLTLSVYF
jgi:hypothetical protein